MQKLGSIPPRQGCHIYRFICILQIFSNILWPRICIYRLQICCWNTDVQILYTEFGQNFTDLYRFLSKTITFSYENFSIQPLKWHFRNVVTNDWYINDFFSIILTYSSILKHTDLKYRYFVLGYRNTDNCEKKYRFKCGNPAPRGLEASLSLKLGNSFPRSLKAFLWEAWKFSLWKAWKLLT